jgi:phosphatidylglycerol:prolipoprotein diacylglycerol transferase
MDPILFKISFITVYSYGFCIMLGALAAYYYGIYEGKKLGISSDTISEMTLLIIAMAYIGGKVFLWFSDWNYYMEHPQKMIELSGSGFVFYGSFIFCIIGLFAFFRFKKIVPAPVFDILAVCTALLHAFGKIGCFLAGCCHGKICTTAIGVIYHNPLSQAQPLDTPLYPVQLIDATILLAAAAFLFWYRSYKKFDGELMLGYVFIYATARFFTEFLRGDDERGFIGILSQSQWVSIVLLIVASITYWFLKNRLHATKHHK